MTISVFTGVHSELLLTSIVVCAIKLHSNTFQDFTKGYKNVVIHISFLEVFYDGIFGDLGQQDHVIHSTLLHILTLPVIFSLKTQTPEKLNFAVYRNKIL